MVRTPAVALVALLLPSIAFAQTAVPQPKFKSEVALIEVAASVRDGAGRFVHGLARNDFELEVDGHSVPIESFAAVSAAPVRSEEGRFIVLLFDDVATSATLLTRMKTIAIDIVDRMGPYDEATILATNGDSMRSTTNREEAKARITRLQPFGKLDPIPGQRAEQGLSTIADLSQQMSKVQRRRKVIIVIGSTTLFDTTRPSGEERPEVEQAWFDAARAAARNNVAVYIIDPSGLSDAGDRRDRFSGVSGFAGETGGLAFANTNNFDLAVDRIWADIGSYYLLGYTAPEGKSDKASKLSVHVKRAGVEVQARRTAG